MKKKKPLRAGVPGRSSKRSPTAATARRALMAAIDRYAIAQGEAQWTNRYRTANTRAEGTLYGRETSQWELASDARGAVERAITAYTRAVRG